MRLRATTFTVCLQRKSNHQALLEALPLWNHGASFYVTLRGSRKFQASQPRKQLRSVRSCDAWEQFPMLQSGSMQRSMAIACSSALLTSSLCSYCSALPGCRMRQSDAKPCSRCVIPSDRNMRCTARCNARMLVSLLERALPHASSSCFREAPG